MTVYIDLLFLLNFIYDFFLLMTVSITLKRNTPFKRLLLGSLLGALTTFIIFLPLNKYLLLLLKMGMGFIMVIVTYNYKNWHYFFSNTMYLYMTSVILAGFLYYLKLEFNNLSYLLILGLGPIILYLYVKEQKELKKVVNYYRKVIITLKNNHILKLNGFIDSGNRLRDPITGKYIILVNKNLIAGIYNIRSPMYVPIKTVKEDSLLLCIGIKNVEIDNKIYHNYLLGLSDTFKSNDYDCLLNYHLLEGEDV